MKDRPVQPSRATIIDIAKAAGISYSSVSRALNGLKGVSEDTRRKVRDIAEGMGYFPNAVAQGLVRRRTGTLGLIIPDITNPFYPELALGVEERASREGLCTFLCNTDYDPKKEKTYIKTLLEKQVDGIILAPISGTANLFEERQSMPLPCVYLGNAPENTKYSYVVTDNVRGGYLAARTLIEKGYRRIGFVSGSEGGSAVDERHSGFVEAMRRYDLPVREDDVRREDWRLQSGHEIVSRMIDSKDHPEALIAGNDLLALGIILGIREKGLKVPDDMAVIGFDDIPTASFPGIDLSTIRQPKIRMGEAAVEIILDLIASGDGGDKSPRRVIMDPELVLRSTC